ncbi:uncharacterized protein LOC135400450 [Ornithodoros turicata]|uniref:uncharacterized protein LOC135400450 n=1 Tax=Ornithodoros turicata TaxID=34597 RepID=UPI0031389FCE
MYHSVVLSTGIKFQPGILHEVFQLLQAKVPGLNEQERCCLLMIDEMSIQQRIEYDSSTSSVRGYTTLPVPGASFSGIDAGNFTASVIEKCFDIGLKVLAITTDMAPGNRSMWQYFGVVTGKHSRVANVAKHPSFGNHIIRVLADVPHLVKNLCSHIVSGQQIIIDPVDVAKHGLVGNTVSIEPIKRLVQHQVGSTFKLAPNLKPELLDPNHFDKMKVCNAMYIFSNSTATALRTMVKEHGWEETVLVTAWFLQQVNHWFDIICSRHPVMALSRHNPARHEEAVASLETFMDMFCRMKIGNGQFKPCQAGVRLSTTSILQLQQYLLEDLSFEFLLTSRFTQDSLENFFSTVRLKNPTPTPMEFKMALKIISISQYLKVATTGSYEVDDGTYFLADFDTSLVSNNLDVDIDVDNMTYGRPILTEVEESAFYYYAGYILSRVIKNNKVCSQCTNAVVAKPNEISRVQQFTLEKSYGVDSLTCPSAGAYELLLRCESGFRSNIKQYMDKDYIISTLSGKMSLASEDIDIPQCHGIKDNIIKRFCHARLQLHLSELSESMCVQRIDRSSMSMCAPRRQ